MAVAVAFKYAMVEINKKDVLVERKKFDEASKPLKKALKKITALADDLKIGFALETPEGMSPLHLGTAADFTNWVSEKMKADFKLEESIKGLPEPFSGGLKTLVNTELVIYSASLFYTGETKKPETEKRLYGELVIGFQIPEWIIVKDFPVVLREIVIAVNNFPS